MPSVYVHLRTYEHLTYQKFTGLICSFLGHFSRRFKAVSEKLAVSIFRVEGRFFIMKTRDVTSVTSQELVSCLFPVFRIENRTPIKILHYFGNV
jgi:uncharacterized membrane protein